MRNKPNYRFGIRRKSDKKVYKLSETNKPILFEYSEQAHCFIQKCLGDSKAFEIYDLKKIKKGGKNE